MTRGGKRKGAGRPPVPQADRLTHVVSVRATTADVEALGALGDLGHAPLEVLRAGIDALMPAASRS